MAIMILLVILLGALLNGGTAVMEQEDVAQHALYGAAGGATAVAVLAGVFWILGLFIEFDLSTLSL
ncbi:MAG: hypothetical protein HKO82_04860 [Acidimicrobiia bacterium]|nr:hypothetical protein [Acidimicrobiia bacterium]NNL13001.1 hypothetical protein [Acidimicrobiia bacterium]RZV43002.1 MAG: hypothetical protein EX267_08905 [Acidimicrobiia bacterium]